MAQQAAVRVCVIDAQHKSSPHHIGLAKLSVGGFEDQVEILQRLRKVRQKPRATVVPCGIVSLQAHENCPRFGVQGHVGGQTDGQKIACGQWDMGHPVVFAQEGGTQTRDINGQEARAGRLTGVSCCHPFLAGGALSIIYEKTGHRSQTLPLFQQRGALDAPA